MFKNSKSELQGLSRKKLIQLLEANIQVSSLSCVNVKVDSDTSGDKVNDALLNDICKT